MAFSGVTSVKFTAAPEKGEGEKVSDGLCERPGVVDNLPRYIPKYPSDRMVLIRQSDLQHNQERQ